MILHLNLRILIKLIRTLEHSPYFGVEFIVSHPSQAKDDGDKIRLTDDAYMMLTYTTLLKIENKYSSHSVSIFTRDMTYKNALSTCYCYFKLFWATSNDPFSYNFWSWPERPFSHNDLSQMSAG